MSATTVAVAVEIALVDLSSVAYPIWHKSGTEPDPDWTSHQIVSRVRSLTASHPHAAICCDSGRSFRHEIDPTYKAQREAAPESLRHQIRIARERLAADGYPVWAVPGFEADDLIASAAKLATAGGLRVLILSADKDLLQLVGSGVRAISVGNGNEYDEAAVLAKFGVRPDQMRDYLTLVGDPSDNVIGAKGIGQIKAGSLLRKCESLDQIYELLPVLDTQPSIKSSLCEFESRWKQVRELITLRYDAPINFSELDTERQANVPPLEDTMSTDIAPVVEAQPAPHVEPQPSPTVAPAGKPSEPNGGDSATLVPEVLAPAPAEFERQLEPRSLPQAKEIAKYAFDSRLFSGFGSPAACLIAILTGRELGMSAMAALRGIFVVEGKPTLSSDLIRALVLKSGKAKYFACTERTNDRATFKTHRDGDPDPIELTYTMDDARLAGIVKAKSAWEKYPANMLAARAGAMLARLAYPDVVAGLYSPDEFDRAA